MLASASNHHIIRNVFLAALFLVTGHTAEILAQTGTTGGGGAVENRQPTLVVGYMICLVGIFPNDDPQGTPTQSSPPDRTNPFIGEIKAIPFGFAPNGWVLCQGQVLPINQNQALYSLLGTTYGGNGVTNFALPDLRARVPIGAGQGVGLPNYNLGDVIGTTNPPLTAANIPLHTHTLPGGYNTGPAGSGAPFDNRQPSLALHFLIAAEGEVMIVPWTKQPTGWTRCDGRLLPTATHSYLFSNIGYRYGGSGANFALPDVRGRAVIGDDNSNGPWALGLAYGNNNITLGVADIPAHTHTIPAGTTGSTGGPGNSANNYQPSLVLRWIISFFGVFPTTTSGVDFPMVGEMRLLAGPTATGLSANDGWQILNGALYSIAQNETLYQLIGTTYGGDGQNTYAVPNLQATVAPHFGNGLVLGETLGAATLFISTSQMPAHAHAFDLKISSIQHFSNGSAQVNVFSSLYTGACAFDKSDDLVNWSSLGSANFSNNTATITDPNASHLSRRFYRAHVP